MLTISCNMTHREVTDAQHRLSRMFGLVCVGLAVAAGDALFLTRLDGADNALRIVFGTVFAAFGALGIFVGLVQTDVELDKIALGHSRRALDDTLDEGAAGQVIGTHVLCMASMIFGFVLLTLLTIPGHEVSRLVLGASLFFPPMWVLYKLYNRSAKKDF